MELALSKPYEPEQGAKISPSDPTPSDREQDVRRSVFATSCDLGFTRTKHGHEPAFAEDNP